MADPQGGMSRDGHQWTKETGLIAGVPCLGTIQPQANIEPDTSRGTVHDVVVIGAGYAGITACRDLTTTGCNVLLIEARDRIGGRSWSSNIDGYPYEMGGTWVHWTQPFIWRELFRYNLLPTLQPSMATGYGIDKCAVQMTKDKRVLMSHQEEDIISESALKKFVNIDGYYGRTIIPRPHDALFNREAAQTYDKMSLADRFAQIDDQLTPLEKNMLEGFLAITCGGEWAESSYFEMLRWWALANWNYHDFIEMGLTYKLKGGQSALQRCIFDEAAETGRLQWAFTEPVQKVTETNEGIAVSTRTGKTFHARRVVCTVPLNVLHSINFSPPLPAAKTSVSKEGHVNHVVKCHAEVAGAELRSFSAFNYPTGKLTYVFGDGTTPAGNTHLVSFGSSLPGAHLQPEEDINETLKAWTDFHSNMDVKRMVFHNWHKDEFARGAWEWFRPGQVTKSLDALRARHGNVWFGSADWAMGWRGFLDGAIEDGQRVAKEISDNIRKSRTADVVVGA